MNLKDDLLNFFNGNDTAANTIHENNQPGNVPQYHVDGLCTICENRPHCVWVEYSKIYCEHYE